MHAKPLLFFMLGWLVVCALCGYSVVGVDGLLWGAGAGLVLTIPMIMGAGLRSGTQW